MKLFGVSIRYILKSTDTSYIVQKYAVMAKSKLEAYHIVMRNHPEEDHLIIDMYAKEELKGWIALHPEIDPETPTSRLEEPGNERRDPTDLYVGLLIIAMYLTIGCIIVNVFQ